MKTELLGGKIGFLEGEKKTQGVGREIFETIQTKLNHILL
jgi:hypothetical protein